MTTKENRKAIEISKEDIDHIWPFLRELNPLIKDGIEPKDYNFKSLVDSLVDNTKAYLINKGITSIIFDPELKDGYKQRLTDYDVAIISIYYNNMKMDTENASSENDFHKLRAIIELIVYRDIKLFNITARNEISELIWRHSCNLPSTKIPVVKHYAEVVDLLLAELFPVAFKKPMTLLEQLQTVRKEKTNISDDRIYPGDIGEFLDIDNCHVYDKPIEGLIAYYVFRYGIDSEGGYGESAIYYNDELVGIKINNSKKGHASYSWISKASYEKIRKITLSYLNDLEREESSYILSNKELEEIQENYVTLSFATAVESKYCEMNGVPYRITSTRVAPPTPPYFLEYDIEIEDIEGNKKVVHCGDVYYPVMCEPVLEIFKEFEIKKEKV